MCICVVMLHICVALLGPPIVGGDPEHCSNTPTSKRRCSVSFSSNLSRVSASCVPVCLG